MSLPFVILMVKPDNGIIDMTTYAVFITNNNLYQDNTGIITGAPRVTLQQAIEDSDHKLDTLYLEGTEFEELMYRSSGHWWDQEKFNTRVAQKPIDQWICTDTPVGTSVLYLDQSPIGLIWQEFRKSQEKFAFFARPLLDQFLAHIDDCVTIDDEMNTHLVLDCPDSFLETEIPIVSSFYKFQYQ